MHSVPVLRLITLALTLVAALACSAQTLHARGLLDEVKASGRPFVLNGHVAEPSEYPVTFLTGVTPQEMCTWFLVASRVLLGAAHCLHDSSGKTYTKIEFESNKNHYDGVCDSDPGWPKDLSQDWAACRLDPEFQLDPDLPVSGFEVIAPASTTLSQQKIEIGGFGCTTPGGAVSHAYNIGDARIAIGPPDAHVAGATSGTPNAIAIRRAPALTCAGDSGGPAFLYQKPGRVFRVVIGVNSSAAQDAGVAYLASSTTDTNWNFLKTWSGRVGENICGIDPAKGCRPFVK